MTESRNAGVSSEEGDAGSDNKAERTRDVPVRLMMASAWREGKYDGLSAAGLILSSCGAGDRTLECRKEGTK